MISCTASCQNDNYSAVSDENVVNMISLFECLPSDWIDAEFIFAVFIAGFGLRQQFINAFLLGHYL